MARAVFGKIKGEEKLVGISGRITAGHRDRPLIPLATGERGDVVLLHRREAGLSTTNIARHFTFSDEDTWGYAGTGSHCLAKNILLHFVGDKKKAEARAEEFVEEVIKDLPDESCIVYGEFIEAWIQSKE